LNVGLTDFLTNLPQSNNVNNFIANESDTKLESFDQKLQEVFGDINEGNLSFKNSNMSEELLISTNEKLNKKSSTTLNLNNTKVLTLSNNKNNKTIQLNVDQLLSFIEVSIKKAKNIDEKELLIQAQKILSFSSEEFTVDQIKVLQKAFNIITKESNVSNTELDLESLIKNSSSSIEGNPHIFSETSLQSKDSQQANLIVDSEIQKLLQLIETNSKNIESKDEINTLEQAQKILSSSKTQFTEDEIKVLQKAFSIITKEINASNTQISPESLIKNSNFIQESPDILPQNNLNLKSSQQASQVTSSDIQKLLQLINKTSKNIESKNEINILEQAQKILSSSKTVFTTNELNIIKNALNTIVNNNLNMGNSSSNTIEETPLIINSLIKGNTDKTKNNKNENNIFLNSNQFDSKLNLLKVSNNFSKNVYFNPYEARKNNNKDKNSELQKDTTIKLSSSNNLGDISKNLNIEQLKTNPNTNVTDLKSLQINKNNIQDGIPTTNLKDLNAQIKEVIISKNTQTFLNESFSVKISPPDLGKVNIQILKNGQAVTVNISTETENAKNIISKTLQSLVGNLRDEGYHPINIKVNVTQEENYLADQNQQHKQEQEQKKYGEEKQNNDQESERIYYTFDDYLRSDLNA